MDVMELVKGREFSREHPGVHVSADTENVMENLLAVMITSEQRKYLCDRAQAEGVGVGDIVREIIEEDKNRWQEGF